MSFTARELGKIYRHKLAIHLQGIHGNHTFQGQRRIKFNSVSFLALYSKYYREEGKYWYGIEQKDWEDWGDDEHLVLLMPRAGYISDISPVITYLHVLPSSMKQIIPMLSMDYRGQKKIDVYCNSGMVDKEREPIKWIRNHVDIQELAILPDQRPERAQQPRAEIIHGNGQAPEPIQPVQGEQGRRVVHLPAYPELSPLRDFLKSLPNDQRQLVLVFNKFENMMSGNIPQNAYSQLRWWNNQSKKIQRWGWVIQDVYFKSQTIVLRRKGDYPIRDIPEYMQMLLGETDRQRQIDPNRLKNWLRFCRRVGWFYEGTVIYEKGLVDTNGLSEHDKLAAEEDYIVCKKEISRYRNI